MAIQNRYEFMYYVQCVNGNPNGDPDMGNAPRIDPETMHGYITDVATKRRIRNYISIAYPEQEGMQIIMQQGTNINKFIAEAHEKTADEQDECAKTTNKVYKARNWCCQNFFDVRTFGAVLSTGPNAGQVRGPVQITFGRSVDPVLSQDISITRMCVADDAGKAKTSKEFEKWEKEQDESKLRTMGRKQFIPYGLYEVRGFISANLAKETGFDDNDLKVLCEAILNMYEHDHSASKGEMTVVSPLILFKHVGTDSDETQRVRQALLGCAPAHKLFDLVSVTRKPELEFARDYRDYIAKIYMNKIPNGVQVGFLNNAFGEIVWDKLPEDETWICE